MWFYPKANSTEVDRCVMYNFLEQTWYTMSLARTTYIDASTFDKPYEFCMSLTAIVYSA